MNEEPEEEIEETSANIRQDNIVILIGFCIIFAIVGGFLIDTSKMIITGIVCFVVALIFLGTAICTYLGKEKL